jgi:pseudouridylate synthase
MAIHRTTPLSIALETTLLLHGVPRESSLGLHELLEGDVRAGGGEPCLVGVVGGVPIVGLDRTELDVLLGSPRVAKANTSNLGVLLARGAHAATTVSTTMELAASAGVRVFATGGLGGMHQGFGDHWDVSADLAAFTRFPVAVIASGVKSILDVVSTREALETLGVPVVGYQTDRFPAFYQRASLAGVDASFDDVDSLAKYVAMELHRTGRGVLIAHPIPAAHAIAASEFEEWLRMAQQQAHDRAIQGRDVTPFVLGCLHELSGGRTLQANIALVRSNARLAGSLRAAMLPYENHR